MRKLLVLLAISGLAVLGFMIVSGILDLSPEKKPVEKELESKVKVVDLTKHTWDQAQVLTKSEEKPIIVYFTANW
tara:strand:+ start:2135 stop:2359 length:225 start_codon:yes stop_codon:yes gene_type:complete